MLMHKFLVTTTVIAVALAEGAVDGAVMIQRWSLGTFAGDYVDGPGGVGITETAVSMPFIFNRNVQSGNSRSTSIYNFYPEGDGAILLFDFAHVRDGDPKAPGQIFGDHGSSSGSLNFTVTTPLYYKIDGQYSLVGDNGLSLGVGIYAGQQSLFGNSQWSYHTPNEQFTVGQLGGDTGNGLSGSQIGLLNPGIQYFFSYYFELEAHASDEGASAYGWLSLRIVPEPASAVLMTAAFGLLARRRTVVIGTQLVIN
jgi:hypothetical protein